jgi:hypothetical protein
MGTGVGGVMARLPRDLYEGAQLSTPIASC